MIPNSCSGFLVGYSKFLIYYPKYFSNMPKVRWAMSYEICSKFHALPSGVKSLKIG